MCACVFLLGAELFIRGVPRVMPLFKSTGSSSCSCSRLGCLLVGGPLLHHIRLRSSTVPVRTATNMSSSAFVVLWLAIQRLPKGQFVGRDSALRGLAGRGDLGRNRHSLWPERVRRRIVHLALPQGAQAMRGGVSGVVAPLPGKFAQDFTCALLCRRKHPVCPVKEEEQLVACGVFVRGPPVEKAMPHVAPRNVVEMPRCDSHELWLLGRVLDLYICIYAYMRVRVCVYTHTHTQRERERERERCT